MGPVLFGFFRDILSTSQLDRGCTLATSVKRRGRPGMSGYKFGRMQL